MPKPALIGHGREVERLIADLARSALYQQPSEVFVLHGPEGVGKGSLLDAVWPALKGAGRQCLWVRPGDLHKALGTSDLPLRFAGAIEAGGPPLNALPAALRGTLNPGLPWGEQLLHHLRAADGADGVSRAQVVVVLEGYPGLSAATKRWVDEQVVRPLAGAGAPVDSRFILTAEVALTATAEWQSYWEGYRLKLLEIPLAPLTEDEVRQFLRERGRPLDLAPGLLEKTGGLPGRLVKEVEKLSGDRGESPEVTAARDLMKSLDATRASWLLAAAYLPGVSAEALGVFAGAGRGEEAAAWLLGSPGGVVLTPARGGARPALEPGLASALRELQRADDPAAHEHHETLAGHYRGALELVPNAALRDGLVQLSYFNYFDLAAVRSVFPNGGERLATLVEEHPECFQYTGHSYQLAPDHAPVITAFREVTRDPASAGDLRDRIAACWRERREEIIAEIGRCEREIASGERSLTRAERELAETARLLAAPSEEQEKRRRKPLAPATRVARRNARTVALEFAGVVLLYASLFARPFSPTALGLGVAFIVAGLFNPMGARRPPAPTPAPRPSPAPAPGDPPAANHKQARSLQLKQMTMENKRSVAGIQVTKRKQDLVRLDRRLNEPFCI